MSGTTHALPQFAAADDMALFKTKRNQLEKIAAAE